MSEDCVGESLEQRENERQYRTVDLLLSMHSSLREKYERRAFWLNTTQIGASMFLSVFAFVSDNVLESWGYHPEIARVAIGLSAILILLLSITEFRVDWKTVASRHSDAGKQLAELKALFRRRFSETRSAGEAPATLAELRTQYERTMEDLRPIPERRFNRLKAGHEFKRILSRRLSENPKAPWWFLRAQLRLEGVFVALRRGNGAAAKGSDRYKVVNFIGVTVCNSIPRETSSAAARSGLRA